ncbi:MAG: hypothetical protein MZW92_31510 [Comamonadaceae bacterium]|nr:hypothetical protein [Comamonadaceae bacterium]
MIEAIRQRFEGVKPTIGEVTNSMTKLHQASERTWNNMNSGGGKFSSALDTIAKKVEKVAASMQSLDQATLKALAYNTPEEIRQKADNAQKIAKSVGWTYSTGSQPHPYSLESIKNKKDIGTV